MQTKYREPSHDFNGIDPNIIDNKEVQKLQEKVCDVSNVFAFCTDSRGQWITDLTGHNDGLEQIRQMITMERFSSMIRRVSESSLEDQIIENTEYPNLKIAAISIKIEGRQANYQLAYLCCRGRL